MKFLDVVKNVQRENKGYIVFIRCGIFFTAVGKDAIIVNRLFGLKVTCMKENVCKCGIPVNSFKYYIPALEVKGYSYVIYDYEKDKVSNEEDKYKEIARVDAKMIEEENTCLVCEKCSQYRKKSVSNIDGSIELIKEMLNGSKKI